MGETPDQDRRPSPAVWLRALLGELASESGAGLSAAERLDFLTAAEELKAALAAGQARVTAGFIGARDAAREGQVAAAGGQGSFERARAVRSARRGASSDRAEVAVARRENPSRGDLHVGLAKALVAELPETMALLTLGRISEETAVAVCAGTATLTVQDRVTADARLAPDLASLTARQARRAADRVTAQLDAAAVVRARDRAAASRRVSIRPAPAGMAYLSVLGPLAELVSAYAALGRDAEAVLAGHGPQAPDGRGKGAVMADLACQRLTGLAPGQPVPMEICLVMPAGALVDEDDVHDATASTDHAESSPHPDGAGQLSVDDDSLGPRRDWSCPDAPADILGYGPVPSAVVRDWLCDAAPQRGPLDPDPPGRGGDAQDEAAEPARQASAVWLRRLLTGPDRRDLVAMDSRRRFFDGALRQFVILRDQTCTFPYCDAPIRHLDHTTPIAEGGTTTAANAAGTCARHNLDKEASWQVTHTADGLGSGGPHALAFCTPTGRTHHTTAPPLTGHGSHHPPADSVYYHDDDVALARLQHDVDHGRPLDRHLTLLYDHLTSRDDPDPWDPDYPQHSTAYAS